MNIINIECAFNLASLLENMALAFVALVLFMTKDSYRHHRDKKGYFCEKLPVNCAG